MSWAYLTRCRGCLLHTSYWSVHRLQELVDGGVRLAQLLFLKLLSESIWIFGGKPYSTLSLAVLRANPASLFLASNSPDNHVLTTVSFLILFNDKPVLPSGGQMGDC